MIRYVLKAVNMYVVADIYVAKGQIISKCLLGVCTFFQKTNEYMSTGSKDKLFRSFFGRK